LWWPTSITARIKSLMCLALKGVALTTVVWLVVGSEAMWTRAEESVSAAWRALSDQLAKAEIDAITRQLARERRNAERIEAARDGISARLSSLEAFRECLGPCSCERCSALGADSENESAGLEHAIAMLDSASARASRMLAVLREDLRRHEGELLALQAAADTSRMNQMLAGAGGDPSSWSDRVARTREFLRIALPAGGARHDLLQPYAH
jgi:hypothetical protein